MSLCFLGLRLKLFISLDLTQLSPHYSVYLTVLNFYHTYIRFLVSWVTLWILEPDPQTLKNAPWKTPWKSPEHQSINITHFCFKAPLCYFSVLAKSCSMVPRRLQTMEDQSQPPLHTRAMLATAGRNQEGAILFYLLIVHTLLKPSQSRTCAY